MEAVKELMLKMADDALIIGHRNSEWTGLGPILEEDISFSSMAQDKIGHALALYQVLHDHFGMPDPDQMIFQRNEEAFKCCHLAELPSEGYDFSLVRHFLFDHADALRYEMLVDSSFTPLSNLAKKVRGELKYHVLHANSWMLRLGQGTEESKSRMQSALNFAMPYALAMFEESVSEDEMATAKIFTGEKVLRNLWESRIREHLEKSNLSFPEVEEKDIHYGGRKGYHTPYLKQLLEELSQVFNLEDGVEW